MEFSDLDFNVKEDLFVTYSGYKKTFFHEAQKKHVSMTLFLCDENKKISFLKFSSFIYFDENDRLEVEFINTNFKIREGYHVVGAFFLDNIKLIFEAEILDWKQKDKNTFVLLLDYPTKMIRFQRRNYFRVKIPHSHPLKVNLDINNHNLCNLNVLNISVGGMAVLVPEDESNNYESGYIFENIKLVLPNNTHNIFFNAVVCHKEKLDKEVFSSHLRAKSSGGGFFLVGLKFEKLSVRDEQAIALWVNFLSKLEINL